MNVFKFPSKWVCLPLSDRKSPRIRVPGPFAMGQAGNRLFPYSGHKEKEFVAMSTFCHMAFLLMSFKERDS